MADEARNLTLERGRVNRLTQAMADLTESHAAQGRMMGRALEQINNSLSAIDARLCNVDIAMAAIAKDLRNLASEQILLGNRIEDAFARAQRANTVEPPSQEGHP